MERVPLLIIVTGTGCVGQAATATLLANQLNLSTVVDTQTVWSFFCGLDSTLDPTPAYLRRFESRQELIAEFKRQCATVRRGLNHDIARCFSGGKSMIIAGSHIDPLLYAGLVGIPTESGGVSAGAACGGRQGENTVDHAVDSDNVPTRRLCAPILLRAAEDCRGLLAHAELATPGGVRVGQERLQQVEGGVGGRASPKDIWSNLTAIDEYLADQARIVNERGAAVAAARSVSDVAPQRGTVEQGSSAQAEEGLFTVVWRTTSTASTTELLHQVVLRRIQEVMAPAPQEPKIIIHDVC